MYKLLLKQKNIVEDTKKVAFHVKSDSTVEWKDTQEDQEAARHGRHDGE